MKFQRSSKLSPAQAAQFDAAWTAAQANSQNVVVLRDYLEKALAIDPDHAGANFFLGRIEWESGNIPAARRLLTLAKDNDVCPLRALSVMQNAVKDIALEEQVPLLDADQLFCDRSEGRLVGNKWLVDHVHPNIEGHQLLAAELCEMILQRGWLTEQGAEWRLARKERWRTHLASLHEDYFVRGKQRLEGLMLWTQGRAKKIREPDKK